MICNTSGADRKYHCIHVFGYDYDWHSIVVLNGRVPIKWGKPHGVPDVFQILSNNFWLHIPDIFLQLQRHLKDSWNNRNVWKQSATIIFRWNEANCFIATNTAGGFISRPEAAKINKKKHSLYEGVQLTSLVNALINVTRFTEKGKEQKGRILISCLLPVFTQYCTRVHGMVYTHLHACCMECKNSDWALWWLNFGPENNTNTQSLYWTS